MGLLAGFNSLQTGKPIQRNSTCHVRHARQNKFQFPSNGKAYPKYRRRNSEDEEEVVSIPFKRESLSKEAQEFTKEAIIQFVSIPFKRESLSKGFCIRDGFVAGDLLFQFPSNGKAYPKGKFR